MSASVHVEESVQIARAPAEVWDAIADYSFAATSGARRTVKPSADATGAVFTYEIELQPSGGMRLIRPVLGSMLRSGLKKDLQKLRGLLEDGR